MTKPAFRLVAIFAVSLLPVICRAELVNRATIWSSWSPELRQMYIDGFRRGLARGAVETELSLRGDAAFKSRPARLAKLFRTYALETFPSSQIAAVITDLYRDPANAYVPIEDMIFAARAKLAGEAFEEQLARYRKAALEWSKVAPHPK
jgi:hypothetical protein